MFFSYYRVKKNPFPNKVVFKSKSVDNGVKAISAILGDHYPEFKGKTCFVHFPGVVAAAWKAACLLVVPETTAKKMAFYSDPAEGLLGDVDAGVLSELIGGLCEEGRLVLSEYKGRLILLGRVY